MQLRNAGLYAEVGGAGDKRAPWRVECCSVGRNISGETALMENDESMGCICVLE